MKTFTKIVAVVSAVMAGIGIVCIVIACILGLNFGMLKGMLQDGRFRIDLGEINGWISTEKSEDGRITIAEEVTGLDVSFGAGKLEIYYDDIEQMTLEYVDVIGFQSKVKNGVLCLEGAIGAGNNSNGTLRLVIPNGSKFDKVHLEVGASEARISGITAEELQISVGVGKAVVSDLVVHKLDAETGIGELSIDLLGKAEEYSYRVECGIGSVKIGDNSYGGIGSSHSVKNPESIYEIEVECGVGKVEITFAK